MIGSKNVTQLLIDWNGGDKTALEKLLPMIYQELHLLASRYLRRERPNHTIQATALVNEAYLRLIDQKQVQWQNRAHFFAIAAQMMRRILINYARDQHAAKRGGYTIKVSLNEAIGLADTKNLDLMALDEALDKLALTDSRKSRLIELWFFAGLTLEETAEVLGISLATAKRDWTLARAWLYRAIKKGEDNGKMAKN